MSITIKTKTDKILEEQEATDEIETLLPDSQIETSLGTINIRPIKLRDFKNFTKLINKYKSKFLQEEEVNVGQVVMDLLLEEESFMTDISSLIGVCSDIEPESIDDLELHEVVSLGAAVIGENLSFFVQALQKGSQRLTKGLTSGSQIPSLSLSPQDSNGQKSSVLPSINLNSLEGPSNENSSESESNESTTMP